MKTATVLLIMAVQVIRAGEPEIFLCDSALAGGGFTKLVYGYVDGKRTGCMGEHELRTMLFSVGRRSLVRSQEGRGRIFLAGGDFREADLGFISFEGGDLRECRFDKADMRRVNLRGADLGGAVMRESYLKGADLSGADLTGADLTGAYLHNARLVGVKGVTRAQLGSAATLFGAEMDAELKEELMERWPRKFEDPGHSWSANPVPEGSQPAGVREKKKRK